MAHANIHIGKIQLEGYSSRSKFLDFVSITNMDTAFGKFGGTSCATPVLQGMAMLVQEFFKKNIGRKLTNAELFEFVKDNCVDLGKEGHDINTGHGLFVLPNPDLINIYKYGDAKMFKEYTEYEKAIDYLSGQNEMDSPLLWKERIKKDNDVNLMWFCVKWANAVARSK